jgi:hypothetical protein
LASKNIINSENSNGLPSEYAPYLIEYELNRLHKRLDDIFSKGIITLAPRRVYGSSAFFTDDGLVEVDTQVQAATVQLPRASELIVNRIYGIKDVGGLAGTRNITILPYPGETIDGATSRTISSNYASILFYSDGTQILVLS